MVANKRNPARFLGNFITLAVEGPQFWGLARTVRRCVSRPPNHIRARRWLTRPFSAVFGRFPAIGHFGRKSAQNLSKINSGRPKIAPKSAPGATFGPKNGKDGKGNSIKNRQAISKRGAPDSLAPFLPKMSPTWPQLGRPKTSQNR